MQSWDAMQSTVNYEQHNSWYSSMFGAANIKTEPGTTSPPLHTPTAAAAAPTTAPSQLESYLKQHAAQQQLAPMDSMSALTPSPSNNDSMQHFFESNMQQQLLQQQQYQQQFQQAQQAAAQNQLASTQLPLGFNPLTPPGLPTAVLPSMTHFYNNHTQTHLRQHGQQTPSPQPAQVAATPSDAAEKMQCALTPRNTPPMDITPPKSPKASVNNMANTNNNGAPKPESIAALEHEQDLISNSSEDLKYLGESELDDDESIRMPIYNSHGKMKHYKCKTCGLVAYTKIAFWEHVRSHMKPEKILQCPKCPFVTELKHHLEYHIRKHKNLKPFQCDKCSYTCVNKSMLNSHRKSHSSVYQYRCSDCDYATKYCHSFKLHLRKYDHKPGMVLDEEGVPNPSVVIDVYGTRRGPKAKSGGHGAGGKRERLSSNNLAHQQQTHNAELNVPSHLSAALQGFPMAKQHQMPASPAKSNSSVNSDLPAIKLNMALQQQHQQQQQQQQQTQSQSIATQAAPAQASMSNLLPPLASILQQNRNMAFFPYWNLNLQVLAAQQQAAVLAQLSPRMRENTLQQLQQQQSQQHDVDSAHGEEDDDDDEEFERKSIDSAMDLSQGTPTKEEQQQQQTPAVEAMNLKLQEDTHDATPLVSSNSSSRRKGRVLKLDTLLQVKCASQSPEQSAKTLTTAVPAKKSDMPAACSPINKLELAAGANTDEDECMEPTTTAAANSSSANTSASSTASSSSGNSSNSSNSNSNGSNGTGAPAGAIYECKYCDIYFKDAVLYTIHMGYHSCDDVFKCNMCGEKCDGPVGLFVHMARNAHS